MILELVKINVLPGGRITAQDAAKYLDVSTYSLYQHKNDPGWPPYFKVKTRIYYRMSDLDKWLEEKKICPPPEMRKEKNHD